MGNIDVGPLGHAPVCATLRLSAHLSKHRLDVLLGQRYPVLSAKQRQQHGNALMRRLAGVQRQRCVSMTPHRQGEARSLKGIAKPRKPPRGPAVAVGFEPLDGSGRALTL
jgi:hypothetical protein